MSWKKLLVLPVVLFGFALDADAVTYNCQKQRFDWNLFDNRDNKDYLYASSGDRDNFTGLYCGHKSTKGCDTNVQVLLLGAHYWDGSLKSGPTVYSCHNTGINDWSVNPDGLNSIRECSTLSGYQKLGTNNGVTYYCKNLQGNVCVAMPNTDEFCYANPEMSDCLSASGTKVVNGQCQCTEDDYVWDANQKKCVLNPQIVRQRCADMGKHMDGDVCKCDDRDYFDPEVKQCLPKSKCNKSATICNSQVINMENFGNSSATGGSATATATAKAKVDMSENVQRTLCQAAAQLSDVNLRATWDDILKVCKCDNADYYWDGMKCVSRQTQAGGGNGGNNPVKPGSTLTCKQKRAHGPWDGIACCDLPSRGVNGAKWSNNQCICNDPNKEFKNNNGVGQCIPKNGGANVPEPEEESCECSGEEKTLLQMVEIGCNGNEAAIKVVNSMKESCDKHMCDSKSYKIDATQLVTVFTNCFQNAPKTPSADDLAAQSKKRITTAMEIVRKAQGNMDTSVWKTAEGNFNGARLASDSIAGVVLGTAGGLITSNVVKKNQIKNGFEDIMCTVGGQAVGSYGDQIVVGIK